MRVCHALPLPRLIGFALVVIAVCGLGYRILATQSESAHLQVVEAPVLMGSGVEALRLPSFAELRKFEEELAQHRHPAPGEKRPRYLFFPWEAWGTGWNNVFQEQLLNTHLAYLSNRGYVFVDYIARDHPPFPDTLPNGTRHPLHIPMNALTAGPTGGGPWGPVANPDAPRGISQAWWDVVCPESEVFEIHTHALNEELNVTNADGAERMMRWAEKLRNLEAECVRVVDGTPFDFIFINTEKPVSIWPSYSASPTLTEFAWSSLITRALSRNFPLLSTSASLETQPPWVSPYHQWWRTHRNPSTPLPGDGSTASPHPLVAYAPLRADALPIRGLLGLHVRRGDYAEHCLKLADWGSEYNVWNLLGEPRLRGAAGAGAYPRLPDALDVPPGMSRADAVVQVHCFPEIDAIIQRVRQVRRETPPGYALDAVYLATNGERAWVHELAGRLRGEGFALVASSHDMQLTREEAAVAQAVDMAILGSSQVFIGNGFSSLTSNVVQLRLAGGHEANTCRFW